jgi:hypothetical protein
MFVQSLCQNAAEPFFGLSAFAQKLSAAIFWQKIDLQKELAQL